MGNRKNTWCLVEKVFTVLSGQSDTESCEDELMPTVEEQAVQSIMEDDTKYCPLASPSKSPVKTYKIVNGKLVKHDQKSSKQVSSGSKYPIIKSEPFSKKHNFVLKDGECTRTCSTPFHPSSRSDPTAIESSFGEESKENDNPDDPDDQISVEDMDLSNIKVEPNVQSQFVTNDYDALCNIEYTDQREVEYYIQNDGEFGTQEDIILEAPNDECLIETELVFDTDYVEEVGANIELSTEEMAPVYAETISCDICDEVFEDRKELMRHIQTMHIG